MDKKVSKCLLSIVAIFSTMLSNTGTNLFTNELQGLSIMVANHLAHVYDMACRDGLKLDSKFDMVCRDDLKLDSTF